LPAPVGRSTSLGHQPPVSRRKSRPIHFIGG
jgi:hypothetical protein